jgi:hypothetical protein
MKKGIDAVKMMTEIQERLSRRWAKNTKLMWEDLKKVRNGRTVVTKSRRRKKSD